jgi:hypothetical protein
VGEAKETKPPEGGMNRVLVSNIRELLAEVSQFGCIWSFSEIFWTDLQRDS